MNINDTKLPSTIVETIELLDEIYPVPTIQPSDDIKAIMYKAGQRQVVTFLKSLIEDDSENGNILTNNILNKTKEI